MLAWPLFYQFSKINPRKPDRTSKIRFGPMMTAQLAYSVGHHRPASETPFEWRFASGPIVARF